MTSPDSRLGLGTAADGSARLFAGLPAPPLSDAQIARFTRASLRATRARDFDPKATLQTLTAVDEVRVMAVDVGGDKLIASRYTVGHGTLRRSGKAWIKERTAGAGYVGVLEQVAEAARAEGLPVGVSYAGPVDGTRVLAGMNVPVFLHDLQARYGGDLAAVYPRITLANDAEAGAVASSVEAVRRHSDAENVIYLINGSGIGGAVLEGNVLSATEAGHVEVEDSLNPFHQRTPCQMFGAGYVCVERVGASKAGIEDMWGQQRGGDATGREIAAAYLAGDDFARYLYQTSAILTAHIVKGMAAAFDLLPAWDSTVVVGHGGTFHVPGFSESVCSILEREVSRPTRMLFTKDFSQNTCLDGAAIAAAVSVR